jgi:hypothetical protein
VTVLRVGVAFLFSPCGEGSTPWIGLGTGWEWATNGTGARGTSAAVTLSGWEFGNFQLGYDVSISSLAKVGPYGLVSVGQCSTESGGAFSGSVRVPGSVAIPFKTVHGMVQFGLKGTFDF